MNDERGTGRAPAANTPAPAPTYEAATARVEEIIRRLDSGEASLNETVDLIKEGKALIEQCASELSAVGDALTELRLDELVERLSAEAGSSARESG
ncbi:MAG TPA: exodeoxyribonuclease VII small subunit [Solirubrobacteraceae bacterium]|nr:exodeoxyribonuclease VII small subunit [Solirubrobacteraceae bacterium]